MKEILQSQEELHIKVMIQKYDVMHAIVLISYIFFIEHNQLKTLNYSKNIEDNFVNQIALYKIDYLQYISEQNQIKIFLQCKKMIQNQFLMSLLQIKLEQQWQQVQRKNRRIKQEIFQAEQSDTIETRDQSDFQKQGQKKKYKKQNENIAIIQNLLNNKFQQVEEEYEPPRREMELQFECNRSKEMHLRLIINKLSENLKIINEVIKDRQNCQNENYQEIPINLNVVIQKNHNSSYLRAMYLPSQDQESNDSFKIIVVKDKSFESTLFLNKIKQKGLKRVVQTSTSLNNSNKPYSRREFFNYYNKNKVDNQMKQ